MNQNVLFYAYQHLIELIPINAFRDKHYKHSYKN